MTPFARLFIFLLFFIPLAYLGASYYRGEDGIENIKRLFGWEQSETAPAMDDTAILEDPVDQAAQLEALERENTQLRQELREKEAEIERLRQQLEQR